MGSFLFFNSYYVYVAKSMDTIKSVATRFGITEQQLRDANPLWKDRTIVYLTVGEEVVMPVEIEKSPLFSTLKGELKIKQGKSPGSEDSKKPKTYPADWFPPKPGFPSPSSSVPDLLKKLGNPKYKVVNPGVYHSPIKFTDGWDAKNVSAVTIPQLKGVPLYKLDGDKISGKISFYTKAHQAVKDLFQAWEDKGLISKIITYQGSFNPRVIKRTSTPSNHSFGTAFDINGPWNDEGTKPAGIGKQGCLLELVPIAGEHGFYWGGFYNDGMHFEYAKL